MQSCALVQNGQSEYLCMRLKKYPVRSVDGNYRTSRWSTVHAKEGMGNARAPRWNRRMRDRTIVFGQGS